MLRAAADERIVEGSSGGIVPTKLAGIIVGFRY